eukprot:1566480-Rhodomonas_salina.1
MPMRDFLATINWDSVELTDEQRRIYLRSWAMPSLHPPSRTQPSTDEENFAASAQLANDLFDIVRDCPAISKNSLLLASFGLDPELPWWKAGIGEGLPEGHIDPQLSAEDMAENYTDEMAEQLLHDDLRASVDEELDWEPIQVEGKVLLRPLSPNSRELAKLCNDDLHSDLEEEPYLEALRMEGEYMFKQIKYRLVLISKWYCWPTQ